MNKVIIFLTISDILIFSAFGLITPIFAIFITGGISGGTIAMVGLASSVFLVVKSIVQIPLSIYIDKKRDKLKLLILGTFLIVLVPIFYAFSSSIKMILIAKALYGIGAAASYPAWYSLFTMHLDRKHRGLEYTIWSTGIGLGTALTAYLGAIAVNSIGFRKLFIIVGIISFVGMCFLFFLSRKFIKEIDEVEQNLHIMHHKSIRHIR